MTPQSARLVRMELNSKYIESSILRGIDCSNVGDIRTLASEYTVFPISRSAIVVPSDQPLLQTHLAQRPDAKAWGYRYRSHDLVIDKEYYRLGFLSYSSECEDRSQ